MRWELTPDGDGTQLVLIHTISDAARDFGLPALAGWTMMLGRLAALFAGQPVPPLGEGWQEYHDHYARVDAMGTPHTATGA